MNSLEKTIVLGRGSVRIILSKTYLQFIFRRGGQGRGRCEKGRFRSMYAVKEGGAEYRSFTNFHNAQGLLSWNVLETSQYNCTVLYRVGQEWSFCNMSICTRSSLQSPSSKNQTKLHSFLPPTSFQPQFLTDETNEKLSLMVAWPSSAAVRRNWGFQRKNNNKRSNIPQN